MTIGRIPSVEGGIQPTIVDAKGDLIVGLAADSVGRLAAGTNGYTLVADSAETTGLKWAAPASPGLTLIARTSFSNVASQAFDGVFTSTYKNYLVVVDELYSVSSNPIQLQLRYAGPTTQASGYYGVNIYARAATTDQVKNDNTNNANEMKVLPASGTSSIPSRGFFFISGVGNASERATFNGMISDGQNGYSGSFIGDATTSRTYTGFLLKTATNITGTVSIFGLAAA